MSYNLRRTFLVAPAVLLLAVGASGQLESHFKFVASHGVVFHGRRFPSSTPAQINKAENTLTFSESPIRILALAGPEDAMFSYRIEGLTNPTLRLPAGARLRLTVVNVDDDMSHDLVISSPHSTFPERPEIPPHAVRTSLLGARQGEVFQGEGLLIQATQPGTYEYFCSLPGHAKGGMHGRIEVLRDSGVKGGVHE
jgi:rusticyanin